METSPQDGPDIDNALDRLYAATGLVDEELKELESSIQQTDDMGNAVCSEVPSAWEGMWDDDTDGEESRVREEAERPMSASFFMSFGRHTTWLDMLDATAKVLDDALDVTNWTREEV